MFLDGFMMRSGQIAPQEMQDRSRYTGLSRHRLASLMSVNLGLGNAAAAQAIAVSIVELYPVATSWLAGTTPNQRDLAVFQSELRAEAQRDEHLPSMLACHLVAEQHQHAGLKAFIFFEVASHFVTSGNDCHSYTYLHVMAGRAPTSVLRNILKTKPIAFQAEILVEFLTARDPDAVEWATTELAKLEARPWPSPAFNLKFPWSANHEQF